MTTTGSMGQALDSQVSRGSVYQHAPAVQLVRTSYERSALDIDEYARLVIDHAESGSERARRRMARRRLDILRDAHAPLIRAALKGWVTPEVFNAVTGAGAEHIDISRNPAKRIWEEMASLYGRPPRRGTKRKGDFKSYQTLLKGTGFDLFWQSVELRLQACNQVLIWPEVVTLSDGRRAVKHRWACPDTFSLVGSDDDPSEIEALVLIDEYVDLGGTGRKRYILWTPDWHAEYEPDRDGLKRTGIVTEDGPDPVANPYGRVPHILVSRDYQNDALLDQMSGEDLVSLTIGNGERRCLLRYVEKMSGFKQLMAYGSSVDLPPQALLDPGYVPVVEGSDVKLMIVDWTTDLKSRQEVFDRDEERAAASRGINAQQYKSTGDYQSGHQARGAERGLAERRIRDAPIWRDAEAGYAKALVMVAKKAGLKELPPEDIEVEVQHAPLEYPTDPKVQTEVDAARISLGLESAVTICQREHPNWEESRCLDFIRKNLQTTAEVNDMKTRHNVADNPTTESRSAEENGRMGGRPPTASLDTMQSPPGAAPGTPTAPEETA